MKKLLTTAKSWFAFKRLMLGYWMSKRLLKVAEALLLAVVGSNKLLLSFVTGYFCN